MGDVILEQLVEKVELCSMEIRILKSMLKRSQGIAGRLADALGKEQSEGAKIQVAIQLAKNRLLENERMLVALSPEPNYDTATVISLEGIESDAKMGEIGG